MSVSGSEDSEMGTGSKHGPTVLSMKVSGRITGPTDKASSSTLTATFMKATGSMTKLMGSEFTST